jgi:hypothetical protein
MKREKWRRRKRCTVGVGRRNEGALQWPRAREKSREASEGERENGEKRNVGPITVIKLGLT